MLQIAQRLRKRIDELGLRQADVARAADISPARLGNYMSLAERNNRTPDVRALIRLAKALHTSTDWLLGVSEPHQIDIQAGLQRLLEIDGMPLAKASVLAEVFARAVEALAASPPEGDPRTRSHLAVQFAWQLRDQSRPS